MNLVRSANEASVVDAAFAAILACDWPRLASLQRAYPHLTLDPGAGRTTSRPESLCGVRATVTWNAEGTAYVVESPLDTLARWIGYQVAEEERLEVVWHGTRPTPGGTSVAQFTVYNEEEEA